MVFSIDKTGKTQVVDSCGWGADCISATKDIEAKLGVADEATRQTTEKYYEQTLTNTASQQIG